MSNIDNSFECDSSEGCGAIKAVLTPKEKDLGGFSVRRAIPSKDCKSVGPWVFFDHMGPATFPPKEGINVRPHPHIGLATVTYLFEGEMLHQDSLSTVARILPGDINLMVAGKGIVHSERQRDEIKAADNKLHGLQLWLALPESKQLIEPAFYHYDKNNLPVVENNGALVKVMIGSAYGVSSPVKTHSPTLYIEARLQAGHGIQLPDAEQRGVYVVEGRLTLKGSIVEANTMAILDNDPAVEIQANEDSIIVLIGGDSLGHRYVDWNFVSSDKRLIEQAKEDWRNGRFDEVPTDNEEFIPLPE